MTKNIKSDLSTLYHIPPEIVDKLSSAVAYLIGDTVYQSQLSGESISEVDLGFGKLLIKVELKDVKVKFIPSAELEGDLKNIANGDKPSISKRVEKSLITKLTEMYKEII
jgi:hypothetical protein